MHVLYQVYEIFATIKHAFTYQQDQTKNDHEESDDGCDIPPPNFQLVKTEVVNDSEVETDTDTTANDGLDNSDTSKNDSERIQLGDLIDATT